MSVTIINQVAGAGSPFAQTYTPTWSGSGTPPAIGNGTITGRYFQIGKLVFCTLKLVMGSTTTYGNGNWTFSLPVAANTTHCTPGSSRAFDNGTGWYAGGTCLLSSTTVAPYYSFNGNTMTASHPHAWASGDELEMSFWYEAA